MQGTALLRKPDFYDGLGVSSCCDLTHYGLNCLHRNPRLSKKDLAKLNIELAERQAISDAYTLQQQRIQRNLNRVNDDTKSDTTMSVGGSSNAYSTTSSSSSSTHEKEKDMKLTSDTETSTTMNEVDDRLQDFDEDD